MQGNLQEDSNGVDRSELDPLVREAVARAFDQPVPEESLQRALRRIEAIGRPSVTNRGRRAWWFALAGAAAVLVLAGLVWRAMERGPSPPPVDLTDSTQTRPTLSAEPMVTLQTYRLVLRDRPDELMTLLDQHAAAVLPAEPADSDPWPTRWRPLPKGEDWEEMP